MVVTAAMCVGAGFVALTAGCVLNPRWEFQHTYERELIGWPYSSTVQKWVERKEVVERTPSGSLVIQVYEGETCNLFYEVKDDFIIRAWDDGGKGCWKVN